MQNLSAKQSRDLGLIFVIFITLIAIFLFALLMIDNFLWPGIQPHSRKKYPQPPFDLFNLIQTAFWVMAIYVIWQLTRLVKQMERDRLVNKLVKQHEGSGVLNKDSALLMDKIGWTIILSQLALLTTSLALYFSWYHTIDFMNLDFWYRFVRSTDMGFHPFVLFIGLILVMTARSELKRIERCSIPM
jgi:hypothetical protein